MTADRGGTAASISRRIYAFRPYNRMQMQLGSEAQIPDGLLAANALLGENSHQGVPTYTHALYQGFGFVISNTALGLKRSLYDEGVRSRYTGKERDSESGLDYFGARYYSSNMGRWMSPDWSAQEEPIPYGKLDNPQSLNLYGYVGNNPLSLADDDGHQWINLQALQSKISSVVSHVTSAITNSKAFQAASAPYRDPAFLGTTIMGAGAAAAFSAGGEEEEGEIAVLPTYGGSVTVTPSTSSEAEPEAIASPTFVAMPSGDNIPIPTGASGPTPVVNGAGNTTGFQYQGGSGGNGMDSRTTGVRVMDPTPPRGASPGKPDGYVSYNNKSGQTVNPQSGRTVSNADPSAHIPLSPKPRGTFDPD